MATEPRAFELDTYYHIYNRGVEKRNLFLTDRDYQRFQDVIAYYLYDQTVPYTTFQDLTPKAKSLHLQLNPKGSETH